MLRFIRGEMQQRVQDVFSILLPVVGEVRIFGERLNISRIMELPQAHIQPRLILNLLSQTDKHMPSVNNTMNREIALESLQFGLALPCILQDIWESDPADSPFRILKPDVMDDYHRGTL